VYHSYRYYKWHCCKILSVLFHIWKSTDSFPTYNLTEYTVKLIYGVHIESMNGNAHFIRSKIGDKIEKITN